MHVARGDALHHGAEALLALERDLSSGGSVIITADGGGPRGVAKLGAVALASTSGVPLVPIGADCRPALAEPHKWDVSRNPLPFSSVTLVIGDSMHVTGPPNSEILEEGRRWLQQALVECAGRAHQSLYNLLPIT